MGRVAERRDPDVFGSRGVKGLVFECTTCKSKNWKRLWSIMEQKEYIGCADCHERRTKTISSKETLLWGAFEGRKIKLVRTGEAACGIGIEEIAWALDRIYRKELERAKEDAERGLCHPGEWAVWFDTFDEIFISANLPEIVHIKLGIPWDVHKKMDSRFASKGIETTARKRERAKGKYVGFDLWNRETWKEPEVLEIWMEQERTVYAAPDFEGRAVKFYTSGISGVQWEDVENAVDKMLKAGEKEEWGTEREKRVLREFSSVELDGLSGSSVMAIFESESEYMAIVVRAAAGDYEIGEIMG